MIHTVGPIYGQHGGREASILARCYQNSLRLAVERGLSSIAFPAISTGVFAYPRAEAAAVASAAIVALRAQDTPTFRAGTTLVEFTIVAIDDKGNPIVDLAKEDLVIAEEGQPREIAFFRFDGAPFDTPTVQLRPGQFTNRFDASGNAPRHIAAIVVDAMNMRVLSSRARQTAPMGPRPIGASSR